jgi:two-component system sensor histidine kinase/response regulator
MISPHHFAGKPPETAPHMPRETTGDRMTDLASVDVLRSYQILDTEREAPFDEIVEMGARLLQCPVAILGFFDDRREWIKAATGWNVSFLPPDLSIALRLRSGGATTSIVPDLAADPRFKDHPLVSRPPQIRFAASAPLVDSNGVTLGALTVLDRAPHAAVEHADFLGVLARQAVLLLEMRKREREHGDAAELRQALEESESRFRELFEHADDLIISIAPDGRLLHVNQAFLSAIGYASDDVSKRSIVSLTAPDARDEFKASLDRVMSAGHPERVETVLITSSGKRMTVEGGLNPKMIEGRALLARVIFRDITERKKFEAELARARDAALESARLKNQFLTNVSHEIRTPMNGIIGMIDLLLSTSLDTEQKEFALLARSSAEQLLAIVNNILHVSAIEAGSLTPVNNDFDLYRTIQRIVEVMEVAALGKDLNVVFHYEPNVPTVVRGEQARVRQVLTNLIDNAVKFTEQGKVTVSVRLEQETDTHHIVRFDVVDTGIGIADSDRVLLFGKFSQVEGGSTRRFQGVGLGLATAKQLVEMMGGLIGVDSVKGEGSDFWFSIPFIKQSASALPSVSSELDFRGKRVLLVDQSLTSRRTVRNYLESIWEMKVEEAENAAAAVATLHRAADDGRPYRVVIFDVMPDADELTFARTVKGDSRLASTGLIYLSSLGDRLDLPALRAAGIAACAQKPVGQSELFDALTIAIARDAIPVARQASAPRSLDDIVAPVSPRRTFSGIELPLPIKAAAPEEVVFPEASPFAEVSPVPEPSAPAPPSPAVPMPDALRVLLVEDNFLNLKLTLSQLEKLGLKADSVMNGKQALEALEFGNYGLILMDCQMPVMDGYEATMEIRRRERNGPRRYIIAMTANALAGDREKCLAAGMDDYLSKPTRPEELAAALSRFIARAALP